MLPALSLLGSLMSAPALAADAAGPVWDWSSEHRYFLETEVRLPLLMWFFREFNEQARVTAFRVRMVTTCRPEEVGKRRSEVLCTIEDVGLSASGLPQEQGLLQPILEELDERLSGAEVQLLVRSDGRLANIDLEGLDRRYQRVGRMNENLRLIVTRAFAGLDLPLPEVHHDGVLHPQWVQTDSWLLRAPVATGNFGTAQVIHSTQDVDSRVMEIVTVGRGILVPGGGRNQYDVVLEGEATFDTRGGRMLDRSWSMMGVPTPSSAISEGTAGYPYLQIGRVTHLPNDQTVDVGVTEDLGPIDGPSALQQWPVLGLMP